MSKPKVDKRERYVLVKEHGVYVNVIASEIELKPILDLLLTAEVPIIIVTTNQIGLEKTSCICISKYNYNKYIAGSNLCSVEISPDFALVNVFKTGTDLATNKLGIWKLLKMLSNGKITTDVIMSGPTVYITVPMTQLAQFKFVCEQHKA